MMMRQEFPDVFEKQTRQMHAQALYARRVDEGAQHGPALARKVLEDTRKEFGLGKTPKPDEATKRQFSGRGKGSSGGKAKQTIVMTPVMRAMAHEYRDDLPEAEAERVWAREVGTMPTET